MKFSKNPYWLKSGLFTLMERVSIQIFRFGAFYLLIRGLSKEDFGIWTLFLIITTFLEEGQIGLIRKPLIRLFSATEDHKTQAKILTSSLTLNTLLSFGIAMLIWGYSWVHPRMWDLPALGEMLQVYIGSWMLMILLNQFTFLQQAHLQFRGTFLTHLFRQGFFFGYVIVIALMPDGQFELVSLAYWQLWSVLLGVIVAVLTGWKYARFSSYPEKKWVMRLFGSGKFIAGTRIGIWVVKSIDQLMLGALVSPAAVATYSTTVRITNLVEVPTQSMADIVFPQSTRKFHKTGKAPVKRIYEKSVGILLAMIVPGLLFIFLFPEFVLRFVAGEQYVDAVPLLQITLLFGLFLPFARQFGTILDTLGKSQLNLYLILISIGLNILFNSWFIPQFGTMGAAYGTLITYFLIFIAHQVILYREIQAKPQNILWYARKVYGSGFKLMYQKVGGILS
ncbi:MAG: flippase [Bacteroidota bacterium]